MHIPKVAAYCITKNQINIANGPKPKISNGTLSRRVTYIWSNSSLHQQNLDEDFRALDQTKQLKNKKAKHQLIASYIV